MPFPHICDRYVRALPSICMLIILERATAEGMWTAIRPPDSSLSFGSSLSMCPSGDYLLVGAPSPNLNPLGEALLFSWDARNSSALMLSVIVANDSGASFGTYVALSCPNSSSVDMVAAIGAPGRTSQAGGVYVFTCSLDGRCTRAAVLTAGDASAGDKLGSVLAVAQVLPTAWIFSAGAPSRSGGRGAVYMFSCSNATGVFSCSGDPGSPVVAASGVSGDQFGSALALSSNASILVVGAPFAGSAQLGAAYIFSCRHGTACLQTATVVPADLANAARFGAAVAISADGTALAVGAPAKSVFSAAAGGFQYGAGAVYVYSCSPSIICTQRAVLAAATPVFYGAFGSAISLAAADATLLLIGGPTSPTWRGAGLVYLFGRNPPSSASLASWYQVSTTTAASGAASGDLFGTAVALSSSASGPVLAAGAPGVGAGLVFGATFQSMTQTPSQTPTISYTSSQSGSQSSSASHSASLSGSPSQSATDSSSGTMSSSQTASLSTTQSPSPSVTGTSSGTMSSSQTATPSRTESGTQSSARTPSASGTVSPSSSSSQSLTRTQSQTPSAVPTRSSSSSPSQRASLTQTSSQALTLTPTQSQTSTASSSLTCSQNTTRSQTRSPSPSSSASQNTSLSQSQSMSPSFSLTVTQTGSHSDTPSVSSTPSRSSTSSVTLSSSFSGTQSPTSSASASASLSRSCSPTATQSATQSITNSPTQVRTTSRSPSRSHSASRTGAATRSQSRSMTPSRSDSSSLSNSLTQSSSSSGSPSATPSAASTESTSQTLTTSPSVSPTTSLSSTGTRSMMGSPSPSRTVTSTRSASQSNTHSLSGSLSASPPPVPILSASPTETPTTSSAVADGSNLWVIITGIAVLPELTRSWTENDFVVPAASASSGGSGGTRRRLRALQSGNGAESIASSIASSLALAASDPSDSQQLRCSPFFLALVRGGVVALDTSASVPSGSLLLAASLPLITDDIHGEWLLAYAFSNASACVSTGVPPQIAARLLRARILFAFANATANNNSFGGAVTALERTASRLTGADAVLGADAGVWLGLGYVTAISWQVTPSPNPIPQGGAALGASSDGANAPIAVAVVAGAVVASLLALLLLALCAVAYVKLRRKQKAIAAAPIMAGTDPSANSTSPPAARADEEQSAAQPVEPEQWTLHPQASHPQTSNEIPPPLALVEACNPIDESLNDGGLRPVDQRKEEGRLRLPSPVDPRTVPPQVRRRWFRVSWDAFVPHAFHLMPIRFLSTPMSLLHQVHHRVPTHRCSRNERSNARPAIESTRPLALLGLARAARTRKCPPARAPPRRQPRLHRRRRRRRGWSR